MKISCGRSNWVFLLVFVASAGIMFAYEGIKELFFKGSLSPWKSHSITIFFTATLATLATLASCLMRYWVQSLLAKEQALEEKAQALISYELVVSAVNHIVNNVLNYFQLIKLDFESKGEVRPENIELLDKNIQEAAQQIRILNSIKNPTDPDSYKDIYPK